MRTVKPNHRSLQRIENFVGNAAWDDFVAWCAHKNLNAMPANAWALAAYIRSLEGVESLPNLRKRVADIGKAHAEKSKRRPERHPLIEKTFEIIEKQSNKSSDQSKLFDDTDIAESAQKGKKPSASATRSVDDPAKSPKSRVMRSKPKLVSKRQSKKL